MAAAASEAEPVPEASGIPSPRPLGTATQAAFAAEAARLEARVDGVIGLSIRHVESGDSVRVRARERFPMASTYKVAIAGAALSLVDDGALSLGRMVTITGRDAEETGPIAQSVRHPGAALSVANLIELMLAQSNNNATDRVLALAGGPAAVTGWLRRRNVRDMRVDCSVNDLLGRFHGLPAGAPAGKAVLALHPTPDALEAASYRPNQHFDDDPRDSTTPDAMVELLSDALVGAALSPESRAFLTGAMARCETGAHRLRGMLPPGTFVAEKTGTVGGTVNDAGLIELPNGRGRLLIAVFIKGSALLPFSRREPAIAEIARSAFDFFRLR